MDKNTTAIVGLKQDIVSALSAAATSYSDRSIRSVRELTAVNEDTRAALTQANQIFVAGSQGLVRQIVQSGRAAYAEAQSGIRALVPVTTAKDGLKLQAALIRSSFGGLLSESNRLAQAGVELAEKTADILTARVSLAAETLTARAA